MAFRSWRVGLAARDEAGRENAVAEVIAAPNVRRMKVRREVMRDPINTSRSCQACRSIGERQKQKIGSLISQAADKGFQSKEDGQLTFSARRRVQHWDLPQA